MSNKITEMMKKLIEAKKEKSAQQGSVLRPDKSNTDAKVSTRRKRK